MANISLRFRDTELDARLPERALLGVLQPKAGLNLNKEAQGKLINKALDNPIGTPTLPEIARGRKKAAVVISDISRLAPAPLLLPPVLEALERTGIKKEHITIVIGIGNHRQVTEREKEILVGSKIFRRYNCKHCGEGRYIRLGLTSRGTPVEVSEFVAEADLKVFTGNIELHRLAGFSGGVKACIGISSPLAIEHNHKLSRLGPFEIGEIDGNLVRADMEEYARILSVDFLVNVVTDEFGNVEAAFAGDPVKAHRNGADVAREKYHRPITKMADLVIVSAGGTPKDASLYQAVKALQNGMDALIQGGVLIAVASCHEGFGDPRFREWMMQSSNPDETSVRGEREFVLGGHKAVTLAGLLQRGRVCLVSEMEQRQVQTTGLIPFPSLQAAIDDAFVRLKDPKTWVIPYGGVTVPYH